MSGSLKDNLSSRTTWKRILFMLLFAVIYGVAEVVTGAVVLFQIGAALITGAPHPRVTEFGQQLATFVYEILLFLTFRSDSKPFPFAPWPEGPPKPPCLPPPKEAVGDVEPDADLDGG